MATITCVAAGLHLLYLHLHSYPETDSKSINYRTPSNITFLETVITTFSAYNDLIGQNLATIQRCLIVTLLG